MAVKEGSASGDKEENVSKLINSLYPVCGIRTWPNGTIEVIRNGNGNSSPVRGDRGVITMLSKKSLNKLLFVATEGDVTWRSMMTLTYPSVFPESGRKVKRDLNRFLQRYRAVYNKKYLWWLEFQVRGAPHIHILSDHAPVNFPDRYWMAENWINATKIIKDPQSWNMTNSKARAIGLAMEYVHRRLEAWEDLRSVEGGIRYVSQYALKTRQKRVPDEYKDVGRFWGVSRSVTENVKPTAEIDLSPDELDDALRALDHRTSRWDVKPKYIFGTGSDTET